MRSVLFRKAENRKKAGFRSLFKGEDATFYENYEAHSARAKNSVFRFGNIPVHDSPLKIQPKLKVNEPDDVYEQEADAMADNIMRMSDSNAEHPVLKESGIPIQRKSIRNEEGAGNLLRKDKGNSSQLFAPSIVHDVLTSSSGRPMEAHTRSFMESRFNHDFSQVKIHDSDLAAASTRSMNALAYTSGKNIAFDKGNYNPGTDKGKRLLAHELTHVIQQESPSALHSAAPAVLCKPKAKPKPKPVEVFSDTETTAITDNWTKNSSITETDTPNVRALASYNIWKKKFTENIRKEKRKKPKLRTLTDDQIENLKKWVGEYEAHEEWKASGAGKEPTDPGTSPAELAGMGGDPPSPAFRKIKKYDVVLPNTSKYSYKDLVDSSNRVKDTGVASSGKVGDKAKISDVFDKAGVGSSEPDTVKKVFSVLSGLEGKFDAINTYDAGFVSAGFIQFITGKEGKGSLSDVLRNMKAKNPADFKSNFHDLGIDVDSSGLVVVDPVSGKILHGSAAVQKIIDDKRLTALFQEAGAKSDTYQQAQARIAYEKYYLPDKTFSVTLSVVNTDPKVKGKTKKITLSGSYKDVLTSEAGKVAIVDRGVQHGTAGGHGSEGAAGRFLDACQKVVTDNSLTDPTVADLKTHEREIVTMMKNRYDVLGDKSLTQP